MQISSCANMGMFLYGNRNRGDIESPLFLGLPILGHKRAKLPPPCEVLMYGIGGSSTCTHGQNDRG